MQCDTSFSIPSWEKILLKLAIPDTINCLQKSSSLTSLSNLMPLTTYKDFAVAACHSVPLFSCLVLSTDIKKFKSNPNFICGNNYNYFYKCIFKSKDTKQVLPVVLYNDKEPGQLSHDLKLKRSTNNINF